jgi:hypothetical protein
VRFCIDVQLDTSLCLLLNCYHAALQLFYCIYTYRRTAPFVRFQYIEGSDIANNFVRHIWVVRRCYIIVAQKIKAYYMAFVSYKL